MHDHNAAKLLAKVMNWDDLELVRETLTKLQLLADYKYNQYQKFAPGKRFIESLALWLEQFDVIDREAALKLVTDRLIYFSDAELSHIVSTAYPDLISHECQRLVAEEFDIARHFIRRITATARYRELLRKSLYLGLSDGARTNELRRGSNGEISNEQIWQAYELSDEKAQDMLDELDASLSDQENNSKNKFNLIWLLDDFSGSGNTYIRYDNSTGKYKGKLKKIYERLHKGDLVDPLHYEVILLLYTATRQAIDHIEYWSERFAIEHGYKPLQVKVLCVIESNISLSNETNTQIVEFLDKVKYYDESATDKHIAVGRTENARMGFAGCALPVVLSHNTPNNSIYLLWGSEAFKPFGLFPRVSRHREF